MELEQPIEKKESITKDQKFVDLILELKKQKNAVILVHNYQDPEIYQVADYIGDSLGLSKKAAETSADIIVFCGVKFMAETAKILSPEKTVLLPNLEAGCALADMALVKDLKIVKEMHPNAAVVSYVNTSADIKAHSDVCCTSMNAVDIVNSLPNNEIIFLPDRNLGKYVAEKTNKKIILWDGYCFVHDKLDAKALSDMKKKNPNAQVLAHPECRKDILNEADYISGTGDMAKFANDSEKKDFIVVTECGMTDKLREDVPNKNFHSFCMICPYMKSTNLELVAKALINNAHEIKIPQDTIDKARAALDKMIKF